VPHDDDRQREGLAAFTLASFLVVETALPAPGPGSLGPRIAEGGLDHPRVVALLHLHLQTSRANTAFGSAHALDLSGLRAPDIGRSWSGGAGRAAAAAA
jgi:hypothetical protein